MPSPHIAYLIWQLHRLISENRTRDAEHLIESLSDEELSDKTLSEAVSDFRNGKRIVKAPSGKSYFRTLVGRFETSEYRMEPVTRARGRPGSARGYPSYTLEIWLAWEDLRRRGATWDEALDALTDRSVEFGNLGREAIRKRMKYIRRTERRFFR